MSHFVQLETNDGFILTMSSKFVAEKDKEELQLNRIS